ncbi:hypothetical protein Y592_08635 [Thermosipho sp. 1070]|nr:hypothetical protein Y592_08635 [Thermosipho sp. 1070]
MKIILKWSDVKKSVLKISATKVNCSLSAAHCSYFVH